MLPIRLVGSRVMLALTLLAAMATGSVSRAQDVDDEEPQKPPPRRRRAVPVEEPWAFGMQRADAQAKVESRLTLEIERIERSCRITEEQKRKLQLAGRGDLKRTLDRVDEVRKRLRETKGNPAQREAIEAEMQLLHTELREELPLRGSMWAKTLKRTLGDDQIAAYREGLRDSRRFRFRAQVDLVVEVFDMAAGCSDEQRQRLTKLLLEETRLPSRSDEEFQVVLAQACRVPEAKLRPIFDDSQWRPLSRLIKPMEACAEESTRSCRLRARGRGRSDRGASGALGVGEAMRILGIKRVDPGLPIVPIQQRGDVVSRQSRERAERPRAGVAPGRGVRARHVWSPPVSGLDPRVGDCIPIGDGAEPGSLARGDL